MTWANYDDVLDQLRDGGLDVEVSKFEVGTTRPIRCRELGGDRELRGWYWLNDILIEQTQPDGSIHRVPHIVGSFGIYRGNDPGKQKISLKKADKAVTAEQRAAIAARHAENARRAKAMRADEARRAAAEAARVWRAYLPTGHSPYLERKGVQAHGARFSPSGNGTIAVPMMDHRGNVHGLQLIRGKDRGNKLEKQYWPKGLDKRGHYYLIGSPRDIILVAEGFATGATLHQSTSLPVAIAFDAGNLLPVVESLHRAYPKARILVCADDDYLSDGNPGVTAARNAAGALSGGQAAWVAPEFPADRAGAKLTDFNDLAHFPDGGEAVVARQIEAAIARAGWSSVPPTRGARPTQGGGDDDDGKRRKAVSTLPLDELVERFIHIDDDTGEFVFDRWTRSVCRFTKMVKMLPARVRTDDIKDHPTWRRRAVYIDQIGFDPGGEDPNILCNRWSGWPTTPKAGSCERLLDLLAYLCQSEPDPERVRRWIECWLAYPIQHPGAKMHSAIVVHGPQGSGKSRFFEAYARIYGEYGIILNQGAIEDKFNADWSERKLFILADEIVARAEMHHLKNQLKNFITGEWVRVNPKNVAAHRERNHMNIVFLSNEDMPVVLENDDRRHCVIYTPPALSEAFYAELTAEIDAGGIEALHDYLLHLDIGDFKPWTRPPMTDAKRALIEVGSDSIERFLQDWSVGDIEGVPFCPAGSSQIYALYLRWCRDHGEKFPRTSAQFGSRIGKRPGWWKGHKDRNDNLHAPEARIRMRFIVPPDAAMRDSPAGKAWRKKPDESETQWVTRCYFAFDNATRGTPT